MSAYICSERLFKSVGVFAATHVDPTYFQPTKGLVSFEDKAMLATIYANILYKENVASVLHRYPGDTLETAPGDDNKPAAIIVREDDFDDADYRLPAIGVLKCLDCLAYQSNEREEWDTSPARALIVHIREYAIPRLPGYDEAAWGI